MRSWVDRSIFCDNGEELTLPWIVVINVNSARCRNCTSFLSNFCDDTRTLSLFPPPSLASVADVMNYNTPGLAGSSILIRDKSDPMITSKSWPACQPRLPHQDERLSTNYHFPRRLFHSDLRRFVLADTLPPPPDWPMAAVLPF